MKKLMALALVALSFAAVSLKAEQIMNEVGFYGVSSFTPGEERQFIIHANVASAGNNKIAYVRKNGKDIVFTMPEGSRELVGYVRMENDQEVNNILNRIKKGNSRLLISLPSQAGMSEGFMMFDLKASR